MRCYGTPRSSRGLHDNKFGRHAKRADRGDVNAGRNPVYLQDRLSPRLHDARMNVGIMEVGAVRPDLADICRPSNIGEAELRTTCSARQQPCSRFRNQRGGRRFSSLLHCCRLLANNIVGVPFPASSHHVTDAVNTRTANILVLRARAVILCLGAAGRLGLHAALTLMSRRGAWDSWQG
jgi:hypothetical protein